MPNIASVLKSEISRLARKVLREETAQLKKTIAAQRSSIAALKRKADELEQQLRRVAKTSPRHDPLPAQDVPAKAVRFSAKGLAAQRRRLNLTAPQLAAMVGVSAQSIYNWEDGKARPNARHLPALAALRTLGRRRARAIADSLAAKG